MSDLINVEIAVLLDGDSRDWQWSGQLSENQLKILTMMADGLSDLNDSPTNQSRKEL